MRTKPSCIEHDNERDLLSRPGHPPRSFVLSSSYGGHIRGVESIRGEARRERGEGRKQQSRSARPKTEDRRRKGRKKKRKSEQSRSSSSRRSPSQAEAEAASRGSRRKHKQTSSKDGSTIE